MDVLVRPPVKGAVCTAPCGWTHESEAASLSSNPFVLRDWPEFYVDDGAVVLAPCWSRQLRDRVILSVSSRGGVWISGRARLQCILRLLFRRSMI